MNLRLIQLVIGLASTLIFLAIAFYRVQLGAVSAALAGANPVWIGAATLIYTINLALRAWRWQVTCARLRQFLSDHGAVQETSNTAPKQSATLYRGARVDSQSGQDGKPRQIAAAELAAG